MRKCALFLLATVVLSPAAAAQAIIENPAKPSSGNAGRIVTLREEVRIEDTGKDFFFKDPYAIRVSPKGDIFVQDGQEQALEFDVQGCFVRNLLKKGEGPGELTALLDTWSSRDNLFLIGYPAKILVFNYDGTLVKDISMKELGWGRFILADAGGFLIYRGGRPDPSSGSGLKDIPQNILAIAPDGTIVKTLGPFYIRGFVQVFKGGSTGMTTWNQLHAVSLDGNTLVLNHTPEYLVETLARDKGAVVRRFRRPYTRVKRSGGGGISGTGENAPPPPEFKPDIFALHVVDGKIWVQTSTVAQGKGILFDVFDPDGRYTDNFYIQSLMKDPAGKPANMYLTIVGGFAYFRDKTNNKLIVIKKCRLVGF